MWRVCGRLKVGPVLRLLIAKYPHAISVQNKIPTVVDRVATLTRKRLTLFAPPHSRAGSLHSRSTSFKFHLRSPLPTRVRLSPLTFASGEFFWGGRGSTTCCFSGESCACANGIVTETAMTMAVRATKIKKKPGQSHCGRNPVSRRGVQRCWYSLGTSHQSVCLLCTRAPCGLFRMID